MEQRMTMNVEEMARQLNVSRPTAYELTKREGFPAIHIGRRIVIPVDRLSSWLSENAGKGALI